MSLGARDAEALETVRRRTFAGSHLVSLALEMQTRRLLLRFYGTLERDGKTYLGAVTFFGVAALTLAGTAAGDDPSDAGFPQQAGVNDLSLTYDDEADLGHAALAGTHGWQVDFDFDGLAYEQTPAVLSSLADDD